MRENYIFSSVISTGFVHFFDTLSTRAQDNLIYYLLAVDFSIYYLRDALDYNSDNQIGEDCSVIWKLDFSNVDSPDG